MCRTSLSTRRFATGGLILILTGGWCEAFLADASALWSLWSLASFEQGRSPGAVPKAEEQPGGEKGRRDPGPQSVLEVWASKPQVHSGCGTATWRHLPAVEDWFPTATGSGDEPLPIQLPMEVGNLDRRLPATNASPWRHPLLACKRKRGFRAPSRRWRRGAPQLHLFCRQWLAGRWPEPKK